MDALVSLIKTSLGCSMIHMHKIHSLGPSLGQPTAKLAYSSQLYDMHIIISEIFEHFSDHEHVNPKCVNVRPTTKIWCMS